MSKDLELNPNSSSYEKAFAMMNIFSLMAYANPDSKFDDLRDGFVAQLIIKKYHFLFETLDIDFVLKAINYYDPNKKLVDRRVADIEHHAEKGYIAGLVFINLLEMQAGGLKPTINKAKMLTYEIDKQLNVSSIEKISDAWNKYRWSSHMWASFLLAKDFFVNENGEGIFEEDLFFGLITEMSTKLKDIISLDLWEIPQIANFPKVKVETLGIDEIKRKLIKSYKSENYFPNW